MQGVPANVFKINVTNGGVDALKDAAKRGARIVAAYEYKTNLDWRKLLNQYGNNYWHGEADDYAITNINQFLFDVSAYLSPVKF
jgi:hypothetical protein